MDRTLGWLTSDDLTKKSTRYLGLDLKHNCSLWEHIELGLFNVPFNETICMRSSANTKATANSVPVYMSFVQGNGQASWSTTRWSGELFSSSPS